MTQKPETVEQAAAVAGVRWRTVVIGLAIVGMTNLANAAMNAAALVQTPVVCVAAINDPDLAKQAVEQRVDQQGSRLRVPKP